MLVIIHWTSDLPQVHLQGGGNLRRGGCKELLNKDHATCRKEFIGSTDCCADSQVPNATAWLE
jgi:hypothetical protein